MKLKFTKKNSKDNCAVKEFGISFPFLTLFLLAPFSHTCTCTLLLQNGMSKKIVSLTKIIIIFSKVK